MTNKMRELVDLLNKARHEYYNNDNTIMSDKEYDAFFDELVSLEKHLNFSYEDSPTRTVGYKAVSSLQKRKHQNRMLSLDKTKSLSDLISFAQNKQVNISWKLDGLTVVLKYVNGRLTEALTRGDGEEGEDITHNAMVIQGIPKKITTKGTIFIRGEAVISYESFDRINNELCCDKKYKHPRNLASGSVRQLDSQVCDERNVEFKAFEWVNGPSENFSEDLELLSHMGFDVVEYITVEKKGVEDIVEKFTKKVKEYEYPVDGLVLTFNNNQYRKDVGETSHHPKHSMAFKWEDETHKTTLESIEWQVSRTGLINPVAVFVPCDIDGTTVQRASLHNITQIRKLKLGIGDSITVYKANMIIPQIDDNLTKSNEFTIPKKCPECGAPTKINKSSSDIETLYCTNSNCHSVMIGKLDHFCNAIGMKGISDKIIEKLYKADLVKIPKDLYDLKKWQLLQIDGFKNKSADNIIKIIDSCREVSANVFLQALGITHMGRSVSKLLIKSFGELDNVFHACYNDFIEVEGIGNEMAVEFIKAFEDRRIEITELLTVVGIKKDFEGQNILEGKSFCITGKLSKPRNDYFEEIEANGGIIEKSVVKSLDYLVSADGDWSSSKVKKAEKYGVTVIHESDLLKMLGKEVKKEKKKIVLF